MSDDVALWNERKHYLVIRYLADSRYDAIDYLYNRLNIIDAKTSTLLNANGLLMATITFLLSTLVSVDGGKIHLAMSSWGIGFDIGLVVAGIIVVSFLAISTWCCFLIFSLTFDHVVAADWGLPKFDEATKKIVDLPAKPDQEELLVALTSEKPGYGTGSGVTVNKETAVGTLARYEESFFDITIKRQRYLAIASFYSKAAGVVVVGAFVGFSLLLMFGP